jgi:hypothetical protein
LFTHVVEDTNYFDFLLDLGLFATAQQFSFTRYQLDELFQLLAKYIYDQYHSHYEMVLFLLKQDYLLHFKNRPKIWWDNRLPKQVKHQLIESHFRYMPNELITKDDLYRYGHFEIYYDTCFVILYHPNKFQSFYFPVFHHLKEESYES